MPLTLTASSPDETAAVAATIAAFCKPGDCLLLHGDLGAGKTTFARGFIQARCNTSEEIVSPTFTLVQTYGEVWHFDLYRLKSPQELVEIGLEEALESGISLIEWPQLALAHVPKTALDITLGIGQDSQRSITLAGDAQYWRKCFEALA